MERTNFTSFNQQVLFQLNLKETRLWLKHELLSAPLDLPTRPRVCSSKWKHVKQLRGTLHCHARVPPNTPSVNWSLGSVGPLDSTSHWSDGWGGGRWFYSALCSVIGVKEVSFWHALTSFLNAPKRHPTIKPLSSGFYTHPMGMMGTVGVHISSCWTWLHLSAWLTGFLAGLILVLQLAAPMNSHT